MCIGMGLEVFGKYLADCYISKVNCTPGKTRDVQLAQHINHDSVQPQTI